jgi:hypothetical protein
MRNRALRLRGAGVRGESLDQGKQRPGNLWERSASCIASRRPPWQAAPNTRATLQAVEGGGSANRALAGEHWAQPVLENPHVNWRGATN